MADESRIQVLKEEGREATAKSYMWLFRSGEDDTPPIVLYKYAIIFHFIHFYIINIHYFRK